MTIGEAVRKDSELKAGITEDDSVLDKYIKRHRNEVSSQKFDAKYMELDTASLDNFIKKQREELSKARSEEHTSELQSRQYLVCRLLLEKKKKHDESPQAITSKPHNQ